MILFMYHVITFFTGQKLHDFFQTKKYIFTTESHLSHIAIVSSADIFYGYSCMRIL